MTFVIGERREKRKEEKGREEKMGDGGRELAERRDKIVIVIARGED